MRRASCSGPRSRRRAGARRTRNPNATGRGLLDPDGTRAQSSTERFDSPRGRDARGEAGEGARWWRGRRVVDALPLRLRCFGHRRPAPSNWIRRVTAASRASWSGPRATTGRARAREATRSATAHSSQSGEPLAFTRSGSTAGEASQPNDPFTGVMSQNPVSGPRPAQARDGRWRPSSQ